VRPLGLAPLTIEHDAKIESFFRMKSTAKQEHNLNFKRNSYIPKMCVDPCPVGSTTPAANFCLLISGVSLHLCHKTIAFNLYGICA